MNMRWQPNIHVIPHYESEPIYIKALIKSIKKIENIDWKPDLIISSCPLFLNILIKETLIIVIVTKLRD